MLGENGFGTYVAYAAIVLFLLLLIFLFLRTMMMVALLLLSPLATVLRKVPVLRWLVPASDGQKSEPG
ncbi:hypothetical protein [Gemmatimonas sp.]|uniref:hypothetical protein n=1 Tax=Gemmatimonas sp. TaxID=1962908 RepID=UPI00398344F1